MQQTILIVVASLAALWLITSTATRITTIIARERTRRDLMAYVAEKAMTPEEAARLIELAENLEMRKQVLDVAAWDPSWESWRETVKGVMKDGDSAQTRSSSAKSKHA